MRKFLLPLITVALVALPAFTARAAETETISTPKQVFTEKSSTAEANPPAIEVGPEAVVPQKNEPDVKIGIIDMAKIAGDSASGKAAYAKVKAKMEKVQKQIKSKETQLKKQKADIEAQMPSLAPIQRSAKANEFQKKLESFQSFIQKAEKDIRTTEAELLKNLYESVAKSAADYGTENGFAAIVINKEILFTGSSVAIQDLTAEIIKLIDGGGKK
ncbi:MAG: OmpH family outer membrane protein [Deltaproteobacteria bacterium]|nr:OmpH family outer membrane protein [Deltaproteobacteria bacterium]TLN03622.1 MAG: OmpH family outer membrane protein [bacterium]